MKLIKKRLPKRKKHQVIFIVDLIQFFNGVMGVKTAIVNVLVSISQIIMKKNGF